MAAKTEHFNGVRNDAKSPAWAERPTAAHIANPHQPPHHRGNTYATGYDRPWYAPTDDLDRANLLSQLDGALLYAQQIAKSLGTETDDYETSIVCVRGRAKSERRAILEGCRI